MTAIITGFTSLTQAEAASAAVYNLARPQHLPDKPRDVGRYALPRIAHPDGEQWGLLVPDDLDLPVHASLIADPTLVDPDPVILPWLAEPEELPAALASAGRVNAAFALSQVRADTVLRPGDAGWDDWWPADDEDEA